MYRSLIMSIALVSLLVMGSQVMADGKGVSNKGNSRAGNKSVSELTDPNCRGVRASLFVIANGGLGLLDNKRHGEDLTEFITMFFGFGAAVPDCIFSFPPPG